VWNRNQLKVLACSGLTLVLVASGSVQAEQTATPTTPAQKQASGSGAAADKASEVTMKACGNIAQKTAQAKPAASSPAVLQEATALSGMERIATDNIFDGAGYGWRPGISYAFDNQGNVWGWGVQGEKDADFPQKLAGLQNVKQISGDHALTKDGQVWRLNDMAQPEKVAGLDHIQSISELNGNEGVLVLLKDDGTVWTWMQGESKPAQLGAFAKVTHIYGSSFSLFVLEQNGKLYYVSGQGQELKAELAQLVHVSGAVKQIALDYSDRALIQTTTGEVHVFDPDENKLTRAPREADGAVNMAVGGEGMYLFSKKDGTVWGWGNNTLGMLGEKQPNLVNVPVQIAGLRDIVDIQAGTDHVIALQKSGHVYSWGSNMTGQLGRLPHLLTEWTEIGELKDVRQVSTDMGKPFFVRKDGTLWGMNDKLVPYQVQGPKNIQAITSILNTAVTVDTAGKVQMWTDDFATCQELSLSAPAKDVVGGERRLLVRLADDRLYTVELQHEFVEKHGIYEPANIKIGKAEAVQLDPAVISQITKLYANAYTFLATTKTGEVLYAEQTAKQPSFVKVPGVKGVRELAPQYFVRYTTEDVSVYAMTDSGAVAELQFQVDRDGDEWKVGKVAVLPKLEENIALASGRLRITKDGELYEHDWNELAKKRVPRPVRLVASSYDYAIEGPGSHYHVLVTEDDKIVVIGYNPYGRSSLEPQLVQTK
jgi:alpha-tubulin suppressor-like RCC1 family protein